MPGSTSERVLEMRALAAQLRRHAAETALDMFRRKFEMTACELEEKARDLEDGHWEGGPWAAAHAPRSHGTESGRGYRH
jgi:hypothetical protein